MYQQIQGEIRRTITRDFPYSLFYAVEPDAIVVLRVIHHREDSAEWPEDS